MTARPEDMASITIERDALKDALTALVKAKREKDANGDSLRYRELKAGVWERAFELVDVN